ncbi:hypothetical protein U1Q18_043343 [Sarracenia purpurea var. burkii]
MASCCSTRLLSEEFRVGLHASAELLGWVAPSGKWGSHCSANGLCTGFHLGLANLTSLAQTELCSALRHIDMMPYWSVIGMGKSISVWPPCRATEASVSCCTASTIAWGNLRVLGEKPKSSPSQIQLLLFPLFAPNFRARHVGFLYLLQLYLNLVH